MHYLETNFAKSLVIVFLGWNGLFLKKPLHVKQDGVDGCSVALKVFELDCWQH